jgi:HPt (histidine-containing phosphotransfer) domain-containing protein
MLSDETPLLLNINVLNDLRKLAPHPEWLEELYQQFLGQTRNQLKELSEAVAQNNSKQCLFLLHAMKSSSGQVGGEIFTAQIEEWELLLSGDARLTQMQYYEAIHQAFLLLQAEILKVFEQKEGHA